MSSHLYTYTDVFPNLATTLLVVLAPAFLITVQRPHSCVHTQKNNSHDNVFVRTTTAKMHMLLMLSHAHIQMRNRYSHNTYLGTHCITELLSHHKEAASPIDCSTNNTVISY